MKSAVKTRHQTNLHIQLMKMVSRQNEIKVDGLTLPKRGHHQQDFRT